jgi:hypothetical protein
MPRNLEEVDRILGEACCLYFHVCRIKNKISVTDRRIDNCSLYRKKLLHITPKYCWAELIKEDERMDFVARMENMGNAFRN